MSFRVNALSLVLPLSLALSACGGPVLPGDPIDPCEQGEGCTPIAPDSTIDLAQALGIDDPQVVGITIDPDSGQRYVLDQMEGIFELHSDGSATLVRSNAELPVPEFLPRSLWTDFVSMGDDKFAITALSDGFLLDLAADTMTQYFCYVPSDMGPELNQLTNSVAFDPHNQVIYAQPITFEQGMEQRISLGASIGSYSLEGGQPTAWFDLDVTDFLAGGAAVDADGKLLLGKGSDIHLFDPSAPAEPQHIYQLPVSQDGTRVARADIQGLAVDSVRGELLVVDGATDKVIVIER